MKNSEKAKIKDITKNTLLSWGILTEVRERYFQQMHMLF
jgi:hypothetical protein